MVVHEASVVAVETDLADEELALMGCGVTTGLGAALNTARVAPGSSVAVIGCGGVGQSVIQGAAIAGATTIIAIDPAPGRRDTSLRMGATHTIDPAAGDPVEQVRALSAGRGVDYSFEVVGRPELMVQAFDLARAAGTVTLVGMPSKDAVLSLPGRCGRSSRASAWPDRWSATPRSCGTSPDSCSWRRRARSIWEPWCRGGSSSTRSTTASPGWIEPKAFARSSSSG